MADEVKKKTAYRYNDYNIEKVQDYSYRLTRAYRSNDLYTQDYEISLSFHNEFIAKNMTNDFWTKFHFLFDDNSESISKDPVNNLILNNFLTEVVGIIRNQSKLTRLVFTIYLNNIEGDVDDSIYDEFEDEFILLKNYLIEKSRSEGISTAKLLTNIRSTTMDISGDTYHVVARVIREVKELLVQVSIKYNNSIKEYLSEDYKTKYHEE